MIDKQPSQVALVWQMVCTGKR